MSHDIALEEVAHAQNPVLANRILDLPPCLDVSWIPQLTSEIKRVLWNALTGDEQLSPGWVANSTSAFFQHYRDQCLQCLAPQGDQCSRLTHRDIIDAVEVNRRATSYHVAASEVKALLASRARAVDDNGGRAIILLAARLMSMHEIGTLGNSNDSKMNIPWGNTSLAQAIGQEHIHCGSRPCDGRLDPQFNAATLERDANVEIIWTSNLRKHLTHSERGTREKTELYVFHQVRYLKAMQEKGCAGHLPADLIEETIQTLALLFPQDKHVTSWINKKPINEVDLQVLSCSAGGIDRSLHKYSHFGADLQSLHLIWEAAGSDTFFKVLIGGRKMQQRVTIWLAIGALLLTALFGLVQSIEGGLQVWGPRSSDMSS